MNALEKFNQLKLDGDLLAKNPNTKEYRNYVNSFLTKELLVELLQSYSINFICLDIFKPKGFTICASSIIDRCKRLNIQTPSIKDSANNNLVRDAYKSTCLKKYGSENTLSKGTILYKKRNKTIKEKYGVSNVFQIKENILKSKETMLRKYGVHCSAQLPWYERNFGRTSKVHLKIEKFLEEEGVIFESEKLGFLKYNKIFKRIFSPKVDILLREKNTIIEIYGDYWHANPKKYNKDHLINRWGGTKKASEIWEYDRVRINHLKSFGYKVIILWELDINKNFEKVKNKLRKL